MDNWKTLVEQLELLPHPEGGYYKECYRSPILVSTPRPDRNTIVKRNMSTSILFLLTSGIFSAFHRIQQDELWYFQGGDGVLIHEITPSGEYLLHTLHINPEIGLPQILIPAHSWFASEVVKGGAWSLSGCMVSPGFDFEDFEMADRDELSAEFPQYRALIEQLTR